MGCCQSVDESRAPMLPQEPPTTQQIYVSPKQKHNKHPQLCRACPSPMKPHTIFTQKSTLRSWEVRILVVGGSLKSRETFAKWLTTASDSPREIRSKKTLGHTSQVFSHITKVMALGRESPQVSPQVAPHGDPHTPPSRHKTTPNPRFLVTTSVTLFAVTFSAWVMPERDCDADTLATFAQVPDDFEGNLARAVVVDVDSIASLEWARHWLEARAASMTESNTSNNSDSGSPSAFPSSCFHNPPNQPVAVIALFHSATKTVRVPREEISSLCRDHSVPLFEVCVLKDSDYHSGAQPKNVFGATESSVDQVSQFFVNRSSPYLPS